MKHARVRQSYDTGGPSTQTVVLTVAGQSITLSIAGARSVRDDLSEAIDLAESLNRPYSTPAIALDPKAGVLDTRRRDLLLNMMYSHGFTIVCHETGTNNEQIGALIMRKALDVQVVRRVAKWIDERLEMGPT